MWLARLFVVASCTALASVLAAPAASASDGPPGFWYGADSDGPGPLGSGVEYTMPTCSGAYGSYVGRIDSGSDPYNKPAYSNAANSNAASGYGVGSQNYYDLAGPLADPSYNGSASEAVSWGEYQGQLAIDNWVTFYVTDGNLLPALPVIYADMESGNPGYGSNTVLTATSSTASGTSFTTRTSR